MLTEIGDKGVECKEGEILKTHGFRAQLSLTDLRLTGRVDEHGD